LAVFDFQITLHPVILKYGKKKKDKKKKDKKGKKERMQKKRKILIYFSETLS